jgi:hypothetical protein
MRGLLLLGTDRDELVKFEKFGRENPDTLLYPPNDHFAWLFAAERERLDAVPLSGTALRRGGPHVARCSTRGASTMRARRSSQFPSRRPIRRQSKGTLPSARCRTERRGRRLRRAVERPPVSSESAGFK